MDVAVVILDIPTQALDRAYSYRIDEAFTNLEVGCAVLVPFGHRDVVGYVIDIRSVVEDGSDPLQQRIKPLKQILSSSYFGEAQAQLALHLAQYYLAPLSSCIHLFVPRGATPKMGLVEGKWEILWPKVQQVDDRWAHLLESAEDFKPRSNAVKQRAILDALRHGDLKVADLSAEYGSVNTALKSLESKGVIAIEQRRRIRGGNQVSEVFAARTRTRPILTHDQKRALDEIEQGLLRRDGEVYVLDGVTGSGKTEVYLCAIENELRRGRTAIVLVPEIALTPQTVARFRGRFGDTVAVLHSRMSQGERFDQWQLIREGSVKVVIGARSALFAPLDSLGVIIIDEEHEGSYKQDQAPRYVTRDVASWMVKAQGATLILGSATPSIEALYNCRHNPIWHRVVMQTRANGRPLPEISVVDMAREFSSGNRTMFSRKLQEALFATLDRGEKAVLLLNQRGFAQFLLCRDCGFVPACDSCSTSLTYHEDGQKLICHHCGHQEPTPARCPRCGSPYLRRFGAGTQRVERELRVLLNDPTIDIIRMDADTTSRKGAHQLLLERFAVSQRAVLLGTQIIAKGLDFDEVTLVGVINADTMLRLPDFRSSERTFDLIEQVAGRSGRAELTGEVIVQTYSADDPAIRCAARYDREAFLKHELAMRSQLLYPPYVALGNLLVWGPHEDEVRQEAQTLFRNIRDIFRQQDLDDWQIFPPTACVLAKIKKVWRYHMLIKAPTGCSISAPLEEFFRSRKTNASVNVTLDVDPISLL